MTFRKYMQKSKKYFSIAMTAMLLSSQFAHAAPAVEISVTLPQPTLAAGASLLHPLAEAMPLLEYPSAAAAPSRAKAQPAEEPASEPSNWSMLLVGAGVLFLPRKRRVDNSVRH
jgi:hypothetical protein